MRPVSPCFGDVGCVRGLVGWSIKVRFLKTRGFLIFGLPTLPLLHCTMHGSIVVLISYKAGWLVGSGKWDRVRLVGWCKVGDGMDKLHGVAVFFLVKIYFLFMTNTTSNKLVVCCSFFFVLKSLMVNCFFLYWLNN